MPDLALEDRRYLLTTEADPRDVLGLGKRRPLDVSLVVAIVARWANPSWGPDVHPCSGCGRLLNGATAWNGCHPADGGCGMGYASHLRWPHAPWPEGFLMVGSLDYSSGEDAPWVDARGRYKGGPRNVLLEVVQGARAGERIVRPFRGLRRIA